jgi:opacity protein-like surface antigen
MKTLLAVLGGCAMLAMPTSAQAQRFGAQLGYGTETDLAVGARVELDMTNTLTQTPPFSRAFFLTSFDVYFPDCQAGADCSFWELTPALAVPFQGQSVNPYLGAGLSIARVSTSAGGVSNSSTEAGIALLGGLKFPLSGMTAFTEARITLSDADQLTLSFGLLFGGPRRQ